MFCVVYKKDFKYIDEIEELKIFFDSNDSTLPNLLEKYPNKTFVIDVSLEHTPNLNILAALYEKYKNIKLIFECGEGDKVLWCKEHKVPFFFSNYCYDWDMFQGFIDLGVSDIYITGALCFDICAVHAEAAENGIRIRVFPNIAQCEWGQTPDPIKFFIRPEDISLYSAYIDVFELFCPIHEQNVLYKIFAKDKEWFGNLNEIIQGVTESINNRAVMSEFGNFRLSCCGKCRKSKKNPACTICKRITNLSNTLQEKQMYLRPIKNKPKKDE